MFKYLALTDYIWTWHWTLIAQGISIIFITNPKLIEIKNNQMGNTLQVTVSVTNNMYSSVRAMLYIAGLFGFSLWTLNRRTWRKHWPIFSEGSVTININKVQSMVFTRYSSFKAKEIRFMDLVNRISSRPQIKYYY